MILHLRQATDHYNSHHPLHALHSHRERAPMARILLIIHRRHLAHPIPLQPPRPQLLPEIQRRTPVPEHRIGLTIQPALGISDSGPRGEGGEDDLARREGDADGDRDLWVQGACGLAKVDADLKGIVRREVRQDQCFLLMRDLVEKLGRSHFRLLGCCAAVGSAEVGSLVFEDEKEVMTK